MILIIGVIVTVAILGMAICFISGDYYSVFHALFSIIGTNFISIDLTTQYYDTFFLLGLIPVFYTILVILILFSLFLIILIYQLKDSKIYDSYIQKYYKELIKLSSDQYHITDYNDETCQRLIFLRSRMIVYKPVYLVLYIIISVLYCCCRQENKN